MPKKDVDFMKVLEKNLCPACGDKECPIHNKMKHMRDSMNEIVEAYFKDDMLKIKKISVQRFSHYYSNFNHETIENDKSMSSIGLFNHYRRDSGQEITLSKIGVQNKISNLIKTPGAFKRTDGTSIQSRFISQIQNGDRTHFNNAYDFGTESRHFNDPLWAIGGAKVSGKLTDVKVETRGNKYNLSGVIHYKLYDKFTDPYDTFNLVKRDLNPNGTPFDITGAWKEPVNFNIDKNVYDNKIKPLIDKQ
ncbi:hypothetical protein GPY51_16610 [Photorhabdus laumondii subsp. laumondii]|uniref:Uncharacterized protein n=1 Tax=Photorhabdus laumondii subsp. laumondii TaxID=141679 RepID=A0A6L9JRU3_PHOLM|nr:MULTISPECIES: hypothetical protein [Photorhabdus]AXG41487.1 hypothetical protein PluDJC_03695 [Photorhabdus laumondii subsp. laumondii]MCC8384275.1 hypothetical protein [Photorhabdus laumondii]MCC8389511.1 hypothetical protein [Photorhabdus laumondii]MCC8413379.1 hypothetical protein [Photorhabdus laumondii]MCZ1250709.1 hypothetical protein [Photorhabdus laumondii subsp. laumondii]